MKKLLARTRGPRVGAPQKQRRRQFNGGKLPAKPVTAWVPPELGSLVRISGTKGDQMRYIVIACTVPPSGGWGEVTLMGGNGIQTVHAKRILPN
jgi:hypothetical protein